MVNLLFSSVVVFFSLCQWYVAYILHITPLQYIKRNLCIYRKKCWSCVLYLTFLHLRCRKIVTKGWRGSDDQLSAKWMWWLDISVKICDISGGDYGTIKSILSMNFSLDTFLIKFHIIIYFRGHNNGTC